MKKILISILFINIFINNNLFSEEKIELSNYNYSSERILINEIIDEINILKKYVKKYRE